MDRLPFTVYDFFGYLSAGFLTLVALATAFVGEEPLQSNPNLIVGIVLVVVAYIVGQVMASLAGYLIEKLAVGAIGRPTPLLFGGARTGWRTRLFSAYCEALPSATQERVRARAARLGATTTADRALFMHCHALVKKEPVPQARLNTFLNLYGFCRNCSLALMLAGLALIVGSIIGSAETGIVAPGWWAAAAIASAIILFYRYLKFFRHYAVEVYASYAEGD